LYTEWNKDGKIIEVIYVSGDRDAGGFSKTTDGCPWLFIPFDELASRKAAFEALIPCTGYPTPGIVNAKTGAVIDADAFGKVNAKSLSEWLSKL